MSPASDLSSRLSSNHGPRILGPGSPRAIQSVSEATNTPSPTRFGFLLLDQFTLISLSSAIEPLRMANRVLQRNLYTWETCSESGKAVAASDGLSVLVNRAMDDPALLDDVDAIIVCGGLNVEDHVSQRTLRWLRQAARRQRVLGAICTGSYALAAAGLFRVLPRVGFGE